jgi:hypothetical protein
MVSRYADSSLGFANISEMHKISFERPLGTKAQAVGVRDRAFLVGVERRVYWSMTLSGPHSSCNGVFLIELRVTRRMPDYIIAGEMEFGPIIKPPACCDLTHYCNIDEHRGILPSLIVRSIFELRPVSCNK